MTTLCMFIDLTNDQIPFFLVFIRMLLQSIEQMDYASLMNFVFSFVMSFLHLIQSV